MLNTSPEIHIVKVKIIIKKLYLKVRFPCSVSIQLKNEISHVQTKSLYPLKDGQAVLNQAIQLQLEADFNPNRSRYEDKNQASLIVYMSSTNGKVVAGSLKFNIFSKDIGMTNDFSSTLQKCPDKTAKIVFSSITEFIRMNSRAVQRSTYSYINDLKHLSPRLDNVLDNVSPMKTTMYVSDRKNQYEYKNGNGLKKQIKSGRNYDQFSTSPAKTHQAFIPSANYRGSQAQSEVVFRHTTEGRSIQKYKQHQIETQQIQRKTLTKVKTQLNYKHMQDINGYENKILKMKNQTQYLQRQVQTYKEAVKVLQRKERNYLTSIKELKQQIQKRKHKTLQSHQKATDFQKEILEKEKYAKFTQQEKKNMEQTLERFNLERKTQQKKYQLRISTLNDQLKRTQQKYKQSQSQRQNSVQEYNTMLNKLQDSQKKQQITLKQRQKKHIQQKTKLNRKVQALTQKMLSMQTLIQDKNQDIDNITNQKRNISKKQSEQEVLIINLRCQIQNLVSSLKKEEETKIMLQQSIQSYKKIQEEKNSLKKRFTQQVQIIQSLNEKKLKLQLHLQQSDQKISEIQKLSKQKHSQRTSFQLKYDTLKKDSQNLILKFQQLKKEKENLQNLYRQSNKKLEQFRIKFQNQRRNSEDIQDQYQTKLQQLIRAKDQLQKDLQQSRWSIQKKKENYQQLNCQYKILNTQILNLNQQIFTLTDKLKRNQEQSIQQRIKLDNLKYDLEEQKKKQRQSLVVLKQKDQQIYELKKKKQQMEQELYLSKDKFVHTDMTYKDKLSLQQRKYREKDALLNQKYEQLSLAQTKLSSLNDQISHNKQTISLLTKDSQSLKILNDSLKTNLETLETNLDVNIQKLAVSQQKLKQQEVNIKNKEDLLNRAQKSMKRLQQEYDQYKQTILASLQHLLMQLSKDQQKNVGIITSTTLKSIVDPKISKLQIQLIQKRNATILKYKQRCYEYQDQIQTLKNQQKKLQKKLYQAQRALDELSKQEREKYQTLFFDKNSQKNQSQSEIKILQEKNLQKMIEIQKLTNELNTQQQFVEQHKAQIYILISQYESLKQQNRQLQQKIQKLRQNEIKQKSQQQKKLSQVSQAYEQILQRLRANSLQLQKQILNLSKQISQKMDNIKKLQYQVRCQCFQKQKQEQRCLDLSQKLKTTQKSKEQSQKKIKQLQKQLRKLASIIDQINDLSSNQKIKFQDLQIQNKRLSEELIQVQLFTQRQKQQLSSSNQKLNELQHLFKSKNQTSKSQIQKYLTEIKELKDKTINLTSQSDLKSFMIKKSQETASQLRDQIQKISNQLTKRKTQNRLLFETNQKIKKQSIELQQKLQNLTQQNTQINHQLKNKQGIISQLKIISHQAKVLHQELQKKDRQLFRLKEQKIELQEKYENSNQKMRAELKQYKTDLTNTVYREEQYRKKSKQLQRILQIQNNDLFMERKKWSSDNQREKQGIYKRIQQLQEAKDHLQQEYKFQRIQLNKQIQNLTKQYNAIIDQLKKYQLMNEDLEQKLQLAQKKLKDITSQFQRTLSNFNRQRQKVQNQEKQLQQNKLNFNKLEKKYFLQMENSQKLIKNVLEQIDKQKQKTIQKISNTTLSNIVNQKTFLLDFEQFLRKSYKNLQNYTQQLLDKKNENRYKKEEYFSYSYSNGKDFSNNKDLNENLY